MEVCSNYTRPNGVMGGTCSNCGRSQPEHARKEAIIEPAARALCFSQGGNCTVADKCKNRGACPVESWQGFVEDVQIVLAVVREKHLILDKATAKTLAGRRPPRSGSPKKRY